MKSTLPSRWQEILRREAAENVGTVLAQAREQPEARRLPRWTVPALVVAAASVSLFSVIGGSATTAKGSVPFDRSTVISTRTAGLGASPEDLVPRQPATPPGPPLAPSLTPGPRVRRSARPALREVPGPTRPCPGCDARRKALAGLEPAPPTQPPPSPSPSPTPTPKPAPLIINVGTRVDAVLSDPVVTGAAFAPATAKLAKDVYVDGRLAVAAGSTLVGEGFATLQDDRAQILFTAIVKDGQTLRFEGWALQEGEMGVRGKVIRKGSKTKKGAGAILGAAANALSFGIPGALAGPEGAALASLGQTAANDLVGLGRDWRRSDKAVRVEKGTPITVYMRRDLTIE
jgi:hypothetical protein